MGRKRTKQAKLRPVERLDKQLNVLIESICESMACWQAEHPDTPVNVAEHARLHGVPYQRLNARWNGRGTRSERLNPAQRLSDIQEQALVCYGPSYCRQDAP